MADLATFEQWLATAKPGSKIVYARANTLGDKHLSAETLAVWHPITCRCWQAAAFFLAALSNLCIQMRI